MYIAVIETLSIVGVVIPTFGILCLLLGLVLGLPLSRATDAVVVQTILAFAGITIVAGIMSL